MNESEINQLLFNSSLADWTKAFDGDPPIGAWSAYDGLVLVVIVILSIYVVLIILPSIYKKYKKVRLY